ncbi:MAG: flagellar hook-length control protein FliK, partial [Pseudomonadales bacterium]|nr:flagellar hook-length control protein FliK [Pseudomonadales bacterium]
VSETISTVTPADLPLTALPQDQTASFDTQPLLTVAGASDPDSQKEANAQGTASEVPDPALAALAIIPLPVKVPAADVAKDALNEGTLAIAGNSTTAALADTAARLLKTQNPAVPGTGIEQNGVTAPASEGNRATGQSPLAAIATPAPQAASAVASDLAALTGVGGKTGQGQTAAGGEAGLRVHAGQDAAQNTLFSLFGNSHTQAATVTTITAADGSAAPGLPSVVGSAQWTQELAQQLATLTRGNEQQVSLHLNPAELGPLVIELKLSEQSAQAHFISSHTLVRSAVEQAIPQLREALAGQGISLGDTMVGSQQSGQQQSSEFRDGRASAGPVQADRPTAAPVRLTVPASLEGRVNLYV